MRLGVCFILGLLYPASPANVLEAAEGRSARLPAAATAAALNSQTGDVAIASAVDHQVWILPATWFEDPTVEPIGPLASPKNPISLIYKNYQLRTYLVIAGFGDQGIHVIDAATHDRVAVVPPLPGSLSVSVSASDDPEDPWVYVTSAAGNQQRLDAFRIDEPQLPSVQIQPSPAASKPCVLSSGYFVVSSSGRGLYGVDENRRTITRWFLDPPFASHDAPSVRYASRTIAPEVELPLVRLPHEQGIAQGTALWLPDLKGPARRLPHQAMQGVVDHPLVLALAGKDLQATSLATGKSVAKAKLPASLELKGGREITLRSQGQTHQQGVHPAILVDSLRDRVVILADRHMHAFPLASLKLPDEPVLTSVVDIPRSVVVAEDVTLRVGPTDPRVETELLTAPEGMHFAQGKLSWTPKFHQMGLNKFVLQRRFADTTAHQTLEINVRADAFQCPFPATHAMLDSSGTQLIVWRSGTSKEIAVLDLATGGIIAEQTMPTQIIAATLINQTAYVLGFDGKKARLVSLDATTLETKGEQDVEMGRNRRFLDDATIHVTDTNIVVQTKSGVSHMVPSSTEQVPVDQAQDEKHNEVPALLTDVGGFICTAPHGPGSRGGFAPPQRSARANFVPSQLQSPAGFVENHAAVVPETFPVRMSVQLVNDTASGLRRADLVVRSLTEDAVIHRWPITPIAAKTSISPHGQPPGVSVYWSVAGTKAVCLIDGHVYVKDLTDLSELDLPQAFQLLPQPPLLAAHLAAPTIMQYSPEGGQQPYELFLTLPGAVANPPMSTWVKKLSDAEGVFEVDVAAAIEHELPQIAESFAHWAKRTASAETIVTEYIASVSERYQTIIGRPPTGVPIAIPVSITARDSQGQTQNLKHYLLADLPKEMLSLPLNLAVVKRWPGTVVASEAEAKILEIRRP